MYLFLLNDLFDADATEETLDAATAADLILPLDQEQINRLENVLRSEEAKDILGDVLSNAGKSPFSFFIFHRISAEGAK